MSKSQISMTDFSIALIIFMILITAIILNLNKYPLRLNQDQDKNEMLITSLQIADLLIKTPGTPSAWENNPESLKIIGLADNNKLLSKDKVNKFINLDYQKAKSYFNYYDFNFKILYTNNTDIIEYGASFNGTSSITTRRYIVYDNEKAIMEIEIWK